MNSINISKDKFKSMIIDNLRTITRKTVETATPEEIYQILQTLQSSLFHRLALRNNNQCHRSGISAAASHADQNPFCRSTGKNHFCADSYYNRPFGGIYHTDCVQVLCDICGAHDGSEDGTRHEKGAFRPI